MTKIEKEEDTVLSFNSVLVYHVLPKQQDHLSCYGTINDAELKANVLQTQTQNVQLCLNQAHLLQKETKTGSNLKMDVF